MIQFSVLPRRTERGRVQQRFVLSRRSRAYINTNLFTSHRSSSLFENQRMESTHSISFSFFKYAYSGEFHSISEVTDRRFLVRAFYIQSRSIKAKKRKAKEREKENEKEIANPKTRHRSWNLLSSECFLKSPCAYFTRSNQPSRRYTLYQERLRLSKERLPERTRTQTSNEYYTVL